MPKGDGTVLKGRWTRSGKYDKCQHCGRTDRLHMAKGLCVICYSYHRDPAKAKAKRKEKRLELDTVAKRYAKVRAWHVANKKRVQKAKAEWHKENHPPKWPIGKECWVKWCGFWCKGQIVDLKGKSKRVVIVRLLGGTIVKSSQKWLEESNPEEELRGAA